MLTDLALANDESKKFAAYCETNGQLEQSSVEFNITVLTTSYWPTYKTFQLQIPREIDACCKVFNTYYQ